MSEVRVPFGKSAADTAVLLLEAADKQELDPSVVRAFTADAMFLAPIQVAKAAGVKYETDEDEPVPAKKAAAKKTASGK